MPISLHHLVFCLFVAAVRAHRLKSTPCWRRRCCCWPTHTPPEPKRAPYGYGEREKQRERERGGGGWDESAREVLLCCRYGYTSTESLVSSLPTPRMMSSACNTCHLCGWPLVACGTAAYPLDEQANRRAKKYAKIGKLEYVCMHVHTYELCVCPPCVARGAHREPDLSPCRESVKLS